MSDDDFEQFAGMLESTCSLLSRGKHEPSEEHTAMWFRSLMGYELSTVRLALSAHVNDPVRGKYIPTPADVIAQIDALSTDGRPGVEEAWAMVPQSETETVVWTREMAEAYGVAAPLINAGDRIAARMAFREAYDRELKRSKAIGMPVKWLVCLGSDAEQRKRVLLAATAAGRITPEIAFDACPALPLPASETKKLPPPPTAERREDFRDQLRSLANSKRSDPVRPLAWAHALKAREEAGEPLTQGQRQAWRDALVWVPTGPRQEFGAGIAIPMDVLPEGMRAAVARERRANRSNPQRNPQEDPA